jgi:glycosyltransferase involved in cell wall biosynthesis
MYKDLSFLLPHKSRDVLLRKDVCEKAIQSLQEMMVGQPYNWELVIVSKDKVEGDNIKWVQEPEGNEGAVLGFNMAYWNSTGKYVCVVIDDCTYNTTFLKGIEFLESDAFKDRKFKITNLSPALGYDFSNTAMPIIDSICRLHPRHGFNPKTTLCNRGTGSTPALVVDLPEELCHEKFLKPEYRYPVFGYVFADRESIKKHLNDHLANPKFKHRYWDNWISFYIGECGEFPLMLDGTYSTPCNTQYSSYHDNDYHDLMVFFELSKSMVNKTQEKYA